MSWCTPPQCLTIDVCLSAFSRLGWVDPPARLPASPELASKRGSGCKKNC